MTDLLHGIHGIHEALDQVRRVKRLAGCRGAGAERESLQHVELSPEVVVERPEATGLG